MGTEKSVIGHRLFGPLQIISPEYASYLKPANDKITKTRPGHSYRLSLEDCPREEALPCIGIHAY